MSHGTGGTPTGVFDALADGRRRVVLAVLHERVERLDVGTLAGAVAARETVGDSGAVPEDRRRRVQASLQHTHLPKLADAGLIDRDDGTVGLVGRAAVVRPAVRTTARDDAEAFDAEFAALADRRRRRAVAVLKGAEKPLSHRAIAERIVAATPAAASPDRVAVMLHHVHLPALVDAGVVAFDDERRRVEFEGLSAAARWLLADVGGAVETDRPSTDRLPALEIE